MTRPDPVVALALGYPFPRESGPFVWRDGRVAPFEGNPVPAPGAIPCVACGSNAAPEQLARKFADLTGIEIPMVPAWLPDHDVVFARRISARGYVPATLAPSPGTRVEVWVQWLSPEALRRMDETEGVPTVYERVPAPPVEIEVDTGAICTYLAVVGPLIEAGEPIALAEVPAGNRRFRALAQPGAQRLVMARLGLTVPVPDFIHENVADAELRAARIQSL